MGLQRGRAADSVFPGHMWAAGGLAGPGIRLRAMKLPVMHGGERQGKVAKTRAGARA